MKKSRLLAMLLAAMVLLGLLAGCSASSVTSDSAAYDQEAMPESNTAVSPPAAGMDSVTVTEETVTETTDSASEAPAEDVIAAGETEALDPEAFTEKIIYSGYVCLQTTAFDDTLAQLEKAVASCGGFVQDSSVDGSTRTMADGTTAVVDRWAYYTVRVPADQFEAFLNDTDGIGNVISSSRSQENVTTQYTDYEARLDSLNIQEERLLAMLEESGDLESLIALEARLSEVRYEIESIERNLRSLDQRIAYSTVNLEIQEVEVYTPTAPVQRSFGEKLSDAFSDGWSGFVAFLSALTLALAAALPGLVLLVVVVVAVVLILRRIARRRQKAKAERQAQPGSEDQAQK